MSKETVHNSSPNSISGRASPSLSVWNSCTRKLALKEYIINYNNVHMYLGNNLLLVLSLSDAKNYDILANLV